MSDLEKYFKVEFIERPYHRKEKLDWASVVKFPNGDVVKFISQTPMDIIDAIVKYWFKKHSYEDVIDGYLAKAEIQQLRADIHLGERMKLEMRVQAVKDLIKACDNGQMSQNECLSRIVETL